jgi:hypothetical protein
LFIPGTAAPVLIAKFFFILNEHSDELTMAEEFQFASSRMYASYDHERHLRGKRLV